MTAPPPPRWTLCGQGASADDPDGCVGVVLHGAAGCLAHVDGDAYDRYLASLAPGAQVDLRGTEISRQTLRDVRARLRDPATGRSLFHRARFDGARFSDDADFSGSHFTGDTTFSDAVFHRGADFREATFSGVSSFERTAFHWLARFGKAAFGGEVRFGQAHFEGEADFREATFSDGAVFRETVFDRALFKKAAFSDAARFNQAVFNLTADFEEVAFAGNASYNAVRFTGYTQFKGAAFAGHTVFDDAAFEKLADFSGITATDLVSFEDAVFHDDAMFTEARFADSMACRGAVFGRSAEFRRVVFEASAQFNAVTFTGEASFDQAVFRRHAGFRGATFNKGARFTNAAFTKFVNFDGTVFEGSAQFMDADFGDAASFEEARFTGDTWFGAATFHDLAVFAKAVFAGEISFRATVFTRATFAGARYGASSLGPLICTDRLDLSAVSFEAPVIIEVAAPTVVCRRTRWSQPATLWLRYAVVDLSDAVLTAPVTVAARSRPFFSAAGTGTGTGSGSEPGTAARTGPDESAFSGTSPQASVSSLRGVDAAHAVLTDLDLSRCLFAGTVHLDQLRLEGTNVFPAAPGGLHRRGRRLFRRTARNTLAEEQHWRHAQPGALPGWQQAPEEADIVRPAALAAVYRALRKSFEDSRNEPGAADFYYGEMEMRRADHGTPRAERGLLTAYWAVSGYGLRATRALLWLLAGVTLTMLVMMLWGLPKSDTPSVSSGTVTGGRVTLTTESPGAVDPAGPLADRLTGDRFEKSVRVVVNSVIFRSSGQDLTTTGTYTEMASRLTEPALLGLAVLAVRARIKR